MARGKNASIGDTRISPNGYHYTRIEDKWELTGRLVMEAHLGRKLLPEERVRYKDNNRLNNDIENLTFIVTTPGGPKKELARLYAKRDEINAKIIELEQELAAS